VTPRRSWGAALLGIMLVLAALATSPSLPAGAQQRERIVVILNARNPAANLSASDLRNIYLGRRRFWSNDLPVQAFSRPETTPAGRGLLQQVLQMAPARFRHHWQGLQLSGQGTAPRPMGTARQAVGAVAATRGGICYLTESERAQADARIKVIPLR
jgi:hypothetical protein